MNNNMAPCKKNCEQYRLYETVCIYISPNAQLNNTSPQSTIPNNTHHHGQLSLIPHINMVNYPYHTSPWSTIPNNTNHHGQLSLIHMFTCGLDLEGVADSPVLLWDGSVSIHHLNGVESFHRPRQDIPAEDYACNALQITRILRL